MTVTLIRTAFAFVLALSALVLTGCGSSVQCTSSDFESRVFKQQVTDPSVALIKAASIKADGGQYVAGRFLMSDGGKSTAVWYITNDGNGVVTSVGAVTRLIASRGADSEKVGIGPGSKGYDQVKTCVE